MAEALVMKDGLALASRLGCNSIKAESESTGIIDELNHVRCRGQLFYADCIDLAANIEVVQFTHISRASKVADVLARKYFINKYNVFGMMSLLALF
jgi:hypothetical protein